MIQVKRQITASKNYTGRKKSHFHLDTKWLFGISEIPIELKNEPPTHLCDFIKCVYSSSILIVTKESNSSGQIKCRMVVSCNDLNYMNEEIYIRSYIKKFKLLLQYIKCKFRKVKIPSELKNARINFSNDEIVYIA